MLCQLYAVTEYAMVVIAATLLVLIIIDVVLRLWESEKRLSSYHGGF